MNQAARRVIFIGQVQGVGFRYTAHRIANRHQLTGFVRNLPDGTVEVLAQGKPEDIENCLQQINDDFRGYITDAQIEEVTPNSQYSDFRITF